jgi:hypothetical protein
MSDSMKHAWNDVADGFSALGRMMKERYQGAGDEEPDVAAPKVDAGAALREAVDRLVAAGRDLGDRAADVARDDEVKAQAKRAAASLNDALSATVDLIGEEVGGLFKRSKDDMPKGSDPSPEIQATEPPADDVRQ